MRARPSLAHWMSASAPAPSAASTAARVTAWRRSPRRTSQKHTATAPTRAVNFVRKAPSSARAQHPNTSGDRARAYRNPK